MDGSGREDIEQVTYKSYLLRLRWVDNAGRPGWRISLEEPGTQTQIYFEQLPDLCDYLANQMALLSAGGCGEDGKRPGRGSV